MSTPVQILPDSVKIISTVCVCYLSVILYHLWGREEIFWKQKTWLEGSKTGPHFEKKKKSTH